MSAQERLQLVFDRVAAARSAEAGAQDGSARALLVFGVALAAGIAAWTLAFPAEG